MVSSRLSKNSCSLEEFYKVISEYQLALKKVDTEKINLRQTRTKVLPGSVLLCPGPVSGLLEWVYPEQLGLSSTACGLVLGDSIRPCTNGVSLLHRIASVAPQSKPQTMY